MLATESQITGCLLSLPTTALVLVGLVEAAFKGLAHLLQVKRKFTIAKVFLGRRRRENMKLQGGETVTRGVPN